MNRTGAYHRVYWAGAAFAGETYAVSSSFPRIAYVDSPRYREIRAQIMPRADDACGLSAESSR